ncbi:hypothetical protein CAPTEDRAFT_179187 [Capitella teleta]|uniref:Uncharacterized protein n=1 Tax=Capitella teleta TaxID=283909 RepID=R7U787_CAPTE|nr:hypothetical protein CAPTEDRAFT_179187 [Capitella teleta]|eukprot:ELT99000.1 hypothetical protein CAPTEDRAFT_179187 [Capitella teleta]
MAVQKVGEFALEVAKNVDGAKIGHPKPVKQVLEEDQYIENVEKIIVRDFFPDLPKLHAQADYLTALEKNDVVKLRELHIKYGPKRSSAATPGNIYATPATFETPIETVQETPKVSTEKSGDDAAKEADVDAEPPTHNPEKPKDLRLDKYLSKVTSEDNTSFEEIQRESELKTRLKHDWLFAKEGETKEEQQARLCLPSMEQQAIAENPGGLLQSWTYVNKNALMYPPEGVPETSLDVFKKPNKPREILLKNTRYEVNPFNLQKSSSNIQDAVNAKCLAQQGKIGVDGKEVLPADSPRVKGYGFMGTPSPAPGVNESPLMTWGEIEGTPFRLDGSDTPLISRTPGPSFKIPDVPYRDRLGIELADKAGASHRAKKEKALNSAKANFSSPALRYGSARSSRISGMSPAAQRLASTKLGIRTSSDKALRASYTPSPSHSTPSRSTPTPGSKRKGVVTPKSGVSTPKGTPKRRNAEVPSLTDNLLNLPKRSKAEDYF